MKHINTFEKHNESILSFITGGDKIAREVLHFLDTLSPSDIDKEVDSICESYTFQMIDEKRVEIVKYTTTIVLLVNDKEVKSAKWMRERIWKKVEDIYNS